MVVAGIVLSCTAFFAGGAVRGARQPGTEAATTRTPTQVEVTNFPTVQAVNGTVNVSNLPAVQAVSGLVGVSNLPVDADGNLRVSSATGSAGPSFLLVKIAEGVSLSLLQASPTSPYPIAGWKNVYMLARANFPAGTSQGTCLGVGVEEGAEDLFAQIASYGGLCAPYQGFSNTRADGVPVVGPEIRFRMTSGSGPTETTMDIWLYLTR
jgi:hypothetical protein